MYHVPGVSGAKSLKLQASETEAASPQTDATLPSLARRPLAKLRLIATSDLHASLMPYD